MEDGRWLQKMSGSNPTQSSSFKSFFAVLLVRFKPEHARFEHVFNGALNGALFALETAQ